MGMLYNQLEAVIFPGMHIPNEIARLYEWIELNGIYEDCEGVRIGYLYPMDKLREDWTETERPGGTIVEFFAREYDCRRFTFNRSRKESSNRLCEFAKTGADGSSAAFWLDDDGIQRIVHIGSGSGSILCCVLADTPVDFLRLLAIGYDEICWDVEHRYPPNAPEVRAETFVHPNVEFQSWVRDAFDVSIPDRATEIIKCPAQFGDWDSPDPFCRWFDENSG